jgi:thiazole synthase
MQLYGKNFNSKLILGTSRYPSPQILKYAIESSGCEIVTVSLRRQSPESRGGESFWNTIKNLNVSVLPNTAGCFSVKEAVTTAQMAREFFHTDWIKLELIGHEVTLQPNPFLLVQAAEKLISLGFCVFPYMTEDLILAKELVNLGCKVLMPWASQIGSGQGVRNPEALRLMRQEFPNTKIIVDAGLGAPSHAAFAMELGMDAVMLNTAVATAHNPVSMAKAFSLAVEAGSAAYQSGLMPSYSFAQASTPTIGVPFT